MDDFTKRYDLKFKNAFVFVGEVSQIEYTNVMQEMIQIIKINKRRVDGHIATAVHGMYENQKADMEIIIPLDDYIELNDFEKETYKMINNVEINNCLKVRYEGNPQHVNGTIKIMLDYIKENNLKQISDVYTVVVKEADSYDNIDNTIIEAYVQVE